MAWRGAGSNTPIAALRAPGDDSLEDTEQARLLLIYTGVCCAITWANAFVSHWWLAAPLYVSGLWLAFGVSFLLANPLFRWTRDFRIASHYYIGAGVSAIVTIAYFTGGLGSPTLFWIASPPLVVALLLGVRAVVAWTVVGLTAVTAMALLELGGLVPANAISAQGVGGYALQTQIGTLVLVCVVTSMFLKKMNASLSLLGEKKQEIDRMLSLVEESELKYRSIFDFASYGIALLGDEIVDCNARLAAFFGKEISALAGKPLDELAAMRQLDGSTLPNAIEKLRKQPLGQSLSFACRLGQQQRNCAEFETTLTLVEIGGERLVLLFAQDVTERNSLQAQLVQSSKLASLGELAAGVAHEINNPLQVISGERELLRIASEKGAPLDAEALVAIGESVERIHRIVHGLRVFARADTGENTAFDLHETIERSVSIINGIFGAQGIAIDVDLQATQSLVVGGGGRMQQVIMNLLSNARDALPRDGTRHIRVQTQNEDGTVVLRVRDSGTGVAPEVAQRLFDPFFTTKPVGEGTGLGLGISRSIVKEMGGALTLEHSSPQGTCFAARLPIADQGTLQPKAPGEPNELPRVSGRCLVVDDEPAVRKVLELLLQSLGLQSVSAADGEQALEELSRSRFDYVFTDLNMPRMGGRELIERAGELDIGNARFIVMTGRLDCRADTADSGVGPAVHGVLTKPFQLGDLGALLSEAPSPPRHS